MSSDPLTPDPSPERERGVDIDLPPFLAKQVRDGEERVGFRRPPVSTRFRPGSSGNPRGRPKKSRDLGAIVARAFGEDVVVIENGVRTRMTKLEATVKQFVNKAAKGDHNAAKFLLQLHPEIRRAAAEHEPEELSEGDALVVADLVRRLAGSAP